MTEREHSSELLADVLDADAGARSRMFDHTLRRVRRHRRLRRVRPIAIAAVALVIGAFGAMRWSREQVKLETPAYVLVHTTALPVEAIVRTSHDASSPQIETQAFAATFHTTQAIPRLTDEQLLAFAGGRPVALIRTAPHEQRLFFLDRTEAQTGPQ